ncbi:PREDICTED: uncharacterized protein LOC106746412 [Dinoponera quadriceps]|uniref:Uncharacterized protein LOC106746412 n=1 Tax=Dinoponera quadriceps TaxID=609295 RepID=A0A6P3XKI7_DINQU|nr:PREDICTED: uncharacterized protein LOC106746412 [Dinoponera quadriceps]
MSRLFLLVLLTHIVLAIEPCIIQQKKAEPDIRVIELDDSSSSESVSSEIVALHLPDRRRREIDSQARNGSCETDEDCGPGAICLLHLTCVRGKWRTIDPPETRPAN